MQFLKLILSFAPWISFLIIAHGSLFRLKVGLIVAALLTIVMAVTKLHRGIIMWVGLVFFSYATIAVVGLEHMWTIHNMGILANGALALGTWVTLAMGKPFTLEYAREHTPAAHWNNPMFIRTNVLLTSVWGLAFSIGTALAWLKTYDRSLSDLTYELVNYAFMLSAITFTNWYPNVVKRKAEALRSAEH